MTHTLVLPQRAARCRECGYCVNGTAVFCPFDGNRLEPVEQPKLADALVGTVVAERYLVERVIGEGGMGRVYAVNHQLINRMLAMKVMRANIARDPTLCARFIQEAKATASIAHPNIVAITDFGELPSGAPYFVMEYLDGDTLGALIKLGGEFPSSRAVKITLAVAAALEAAHAMGIVHRDLKPDNIFLPRTGDDDRLRVVDFGAARVLGASRLTKTGVVFGTPHYMSPEQACGQPVDHRSDIYSLGIILYQMFTGRVPFEADTYMGVLTKHLVAQPTPPSMVCEAARNLGPLEDITLKCLEKKSEDRFQSMGELRNAISQVVEWNEGAMRIRGSGGGPRGEVASIADSIEFPPGDEVVAIRRSVLRTRRRSIGLIAMISLVIGGSIAVVVAKLSDSSPAVNDRAEASASISTVVPAIPPPAVVVAKQVRLTSRVAGAEVYRNGSLVGKVPSDVTIEGSEARVSVRAAGFAERQIVLNADSAAEVSVDLTPVPSAGTKTRATYFPPPSPKTPTVEDSVPLPYPPPRVNPPTPNADPDDPFLRKK